MKRRDFFFNSLFVSALLTAFGKKASASKFVSNALNSSSDLDDVYKYTLVVIHADNQLKAVINGSLFCDSNYHDGDNELNIRADFTDLLHGKELNTLKIEGWNGETTVRDNKVQYNPWHFHYRVEEQNMTTKEIKIIAQNNLTNSGPKEAMPPYLAGTWIHQIEKK